MTDVFTLSPMLIAVYVGVGMVDMYLLHRKSWRLTSNEMESVATAALSGGATRSRRWRSRWRRRVCRRRRSSSAV